MQRIIIHFTSLNKMWQNDQLLCFRGLHEMNNNHDLSMITWLVYQYFLYAYFQDSIDQCPMLIKIMALIQNAPQCRSLPINVGIERNWSELIGVDRHWALIEGVLIFYEEKLLTHCMHHVHCKGSDAQFDRFHISVCLSQTPAHAGHITGPE